MFPRAITADVRNRISYFYTRPFYTSFGLMFTLCFGAPVVGVLGSIGGWKIFTGLLLVWALIFYRILSVKTRKIKKAKEVYATGRTVTIYAEGLEHNYNTQINGAPQPVILLRVEGEIVKIKTFNQRVIRAFDVPVQQAYVLDKYPDILLPERLFTMDMANIPAKSRAIEL